MQGEQGDGQPEDERTSADVAIDFKFFHIVFLNKSHDVRGLDDEGDEIGEDTHDRPGNKNKDKYPGNPFFQVSILSKEVPCVEQEADQEDDPKDYGENGADGIRDVGDRILDAPDLCVSSCGR